MLITVTDYNNEINRVQTALDKTTSAKQRRDYGKYLNRLKRELSGAQMVIVDGKQIKEDTFYTLKDGKVVEADDD